LNSKRKNYLSSVLKVPSMTVWPYGFGHVRMDAEGNGEEYVEDQKLSVRKQKWMRKRLWFHTPF
jgi:hypothetical protein